MCGIFLVLVLYIISRYHIIPYPLGLCYITRVVTLDFPGSGVLHGAT
jgi:hypothetical protein